MRSAGSRYGLRTLALGYLVLLLLLPCSMIVYNTFKDGARAGVGGADRSGVRLGLQADA